MSALPERFTSKVRVDPETGCHLWTGSLNRGGYGRYWSDGGSRQSHRYAYETAVGPIPTGLQIDHICRNRACVNPDHLEPVTNTENFVRRVDWIAETHRTGRCRHGHTDDFYTTRPGRRQCRPCTLARMRRYRQPGKIAA